MARGRGTPRGRSRRGNRNSTTVPKENPKCNLNIDEDDAEERKFVRPNRISPHLFCVICSEVFNKPFRAPCGHSYCYSCIDMWLRKGSPCCPVDRKPVTIHQLHHDFILESIIGDYTVACPWRSCGCSYVGPLCQLSSHKKECVMNPDQLPEALRDREKQNIKLREMQQSASSPSLTSVLGPIESPVTTTSSANTRNGNSRGTSESSFTGGGEEKTPKAPDDSVFSDEDDDGYLPPPPMPSLLMRLYQKSDDASRNLLCSFLSSDTNTRTISRDVGGGGNRGRKRQRNGERL